MNIWTLQTILKPLLGFLSPRYGVTGHAKRRKKVKYEKNQENNRYGVKSTMIINGSVPGLCSETGIALVGIKPRLFVHYTRKAHRLSQYTWWSLYYKNRPLLHPCEECNKIFHVPYICWEKMHRIDQGFRSKIHSIEIEINYTHRRVGRLIVPEILSKIAWSTGAIMYRIRTDSRLTDSVNCSTF